MTSKPDPADVHVGSRVRLRRTLLGMSQEKLGEALGLTFQQVQKYERGANRIGSGRLFHLADILGVPVSFFFENMPAEATKSAPAASGLSEGAAEPYETDNLSKRETLELVRAYYRISDPITRKKVFDMVKTISGIVAPLPEGTPRRGRPRKIK